MEEDDLMRCFICIDLPKEISDEVVRVQTELQKKKIFTGKLVESENFHLSLKFLGEIEPEKVEKVKLKLKGIKFDKIGAALGESGVFNSNFIKIVWIHVLGKQIIELQKKIDEELKDLFSLDLHSELLSSQHHEFVSHLTIARVKKVKDRKIFLEELKKINIKNLTFEIDKFYLMESELTTHGPIYTILEEYPLK